MTDHERAERAVANERRKNLDRQCVSTEFGTAVRCTMEPDHKGKHRGMLRGVVITWG